MRLLMRYEAPDGTLLEEEWWEMPLRDWARCGIGWRYTLYLWSRELAKSFLRRVKATA